MKLKNNAKWIETFCAYAVNNYVIKDEKLIVGDLSDEHLPDIYNTSHSLGIEVVQLEKDCDLDTQYIWREYKEKTEILNQ